MNILPILDARWTLNNCSKDGMNFIFDEAGEAFTTITKEEIATLSDTLVLTAVLSEDFSGYEQHVECILTIRLGSEVTTYTCLLSNNINNICRIAMIMQHTAFDEFTVRLIAHEPCIVFQFNLDSTIQSYEEVIEELRSELPKLLYDYNTYDLTLSQEETTVGLITANLLEATDLQGHFTISFIASEFSEVILRVYDDNKKCLYSPSIITVAAGKHTIGFPHSYLHCTAGFHNFYVTLQCTRGTVYVATRQMLFTIDGAHMAERLLDTFGLVNDITAKTTIASREPVLLYAIGVTENIATVTHIVPNDIGVSNWVADMAISGVKAAAIEFDGEWVRTPQGIMYVTHEYPQIFFVDLDGNLYMQYFNDSASRALIATNVEKVYACRGWKFFNHVVDNDTGLIVAYIKNDGKAYYKHYSGTYINPTPIWYEEAELPFTEAVLPIKTIAVTRLNDYRIAFSIEDAIGNGYSLITKRYYQGSSVASETIGAAIVGKFGFAPPTAPAIVAAWNTSNFETYVRFSHPMQESYESKQSAFELRDANNVLYAITATAATDEPDVIKLLHNTIGGFAPPLRVEFINAYTDGIQGPLTTNVNGCSFALPASTFPFDAVDFSPKGYSHEYIGAQIDFAIDLIPIDEEYAEVEEQVVADIDLTTLELKRVYYISGYNKDEQIVSYMDLSLVLTKVGTDPL